MQRSYLAESINSYDGTTPWGRKINRIASKYGLACPSILRRILFIHSADYRYNRSDRFDSDSLYEGIGEFAKVCQGAVNLRNLFGECGPYLSFVAASEDCATISDLGFAMRVLQEAAARNRPASIDEVFLPRVVPALCDYWILASGRLVADTFPSQARMRSSRNVSVGIDPCLTSFVSDALSVIKLGYTESRLTYQLTLYGDKVAMSSVDHPIGMRLHRFERQLLKQEGRRALTAATTR
jgi:hypothetical protein